MGVLNKSRAAKLNCNHCLISFDPLLLVPAKCLSCFTTLVVIVALPNCMLLYRLLLLRFV